MENRPLIITAGDFVFNGYNRFSGLYQDEVQRLPNNRKPYRCKKSFSIVWKPAQDRLRLCYQSRISTSA